MEAGDHEVMLVERARAGDAHAFEGLMRTYQEDVFRMVFFRTGSKMDAEDITQEVFMKAFGKISGLRDASQFRPWLLRIAINRVRDFHRRKRILFFVPGTGVHGPGTSDAEASNGDNDSMHLAANPGGGDIVERMAKREFWQHVESFLGRLSSLEKEAFVLRFMDQLSIKEMVQVLGKNESTVKTHLYRALKKLRGEPGLVSLLEEGA